VNPIIHPQRTPRIRIISREGREGREADTEFPAFSTPSPLWQLFDMITQSRSIEMDDINETAQISEETFDEFLAADNMLKECEDAAISEIVADQELNG
jgi:hypothetical protein